MKFQKIAIGIFIASSLISCVGHQNQENLSSKNLIVSNNLQIRPEPVLYEHNIYFSDPGKTDRYGTTYQYLKKPCNETKLDLLIIDINNSGSIGGSGYADYRTKIDNTTFPECHPYVFTCTAESGCFYHSMSVYPTFAEDDRWFQDHSNVELINTKMTDKNIFTNLKTMVSTNTIFDLKAITTNLGGIIQTDAVRGINVKYDNVYDPKVIVSQNEQNYIIQSEATFSTDFSLSYKSNMDNWKFYITDIIPEKFKKTNIANNSSFSFSYFDNNHILQSKLVIGKSRAINDLLDINGNKVVLDYISNDMTYGVGHIDQNKFYVYNFSSKIVNAINTNLNLGTVEKITDDKVIIFNNKSVESYMFLIEQNNLYKITNVWNKISANSFPNKFQSLKISDNGKYMLISSENPPYIFFPNGIAQYLQDNVQPIQ